MPRASLSSAAEAQRSFVKILRILPEIVSNFVQYTPPSFTFSEIERCVCSAHPCAHNKNSLVDAGFTDPGYLDEVLKDWLVQDAQNAEKQDNNPKRVETRRQLAEAMKKIRNLLAEQTQ